MRLSPRSIFFSLVALGLPFAVSAGWALGTPAPAPPAVSAPGGAGGIGAAPPKPVTPATTRVLEWSPRPPRPVAVESSLPATPGASATTTAPSSGPAVVDPSGSPDPSLPVQPPVPTPTADDSSSPSPSPAVPSDSADPVAPGLGAAKLVRGF